MADAIQEVRLREQVGEGEKIGGLGEHDIILQKDGHADGADQRREPRGLAQGFVGYFFNGKAVSCRIKDGDDCGQQ